MTYFFKVEKDKTMRAFAIASGILFTVLLSIGLYNGIQPNTPVEATFYDTYMYQPECIRNITVQYYATPDSAITHTYLDHCDYTLSPSVEKAYICYSAWFPKTFGPYPCDGKSQTAQVCLIFGVSSAVFCIGITCILATCCQRNQRTDIMDEKQNPIEYSMPIHSVEMDVEMMNKTTLGINNKAPVIVINP